MFHSLLLSVLISLAHSFLFASFTLSCLVRSFFPHPLSHVTFSLTCHSCLIPCLLSHSLSRITISRSLSLVPCSLSCHILSLLSHPLSYRPFSLSLFLSCLIPSLIPTPSLVFDHASLWSSEAQEGHVSTAPPSSAATSQLPAAQGGATETTSLEAPLLSADQLGGGGDGAGIGAGSKLSQAMRQEDDDRREAILQVLQCVAVCCIVLQCVKKMMIDVRPSYRSCSVLQCVAVCCNASGR